MRILALETSTEYCSAALWLDGVVAERSELAGQRHSELLLPMVDMLLHAENIALRDLDGIAFGAGPGSFTGVRIACGVAQGLSLGANLPVVAICTLLALAEASGQDRVIAVIDARMAEVYHAVYQKLGGRWTTLSEPGLYPPQQAPAVSGAGWFGVGSGFIAHEDMLQEHYAANLDGVNAAAVPEAGAISRLAAQRFLDGEGVDAAQALPLYLRDKVALKTAERENRMA